MDAVMSPASLYNRCGAAISHSAELVRGDFLCKSEAPLIRSFRPPSPQGEKGRKPFRVPYPSVTPQALVHCKPSTVPRRGRYSQPT